MTRKLTYLKSRQYSTRYASVHNAGALVEEIRNVVLVDPQLVSEQRHFRSKISRHAQGQKRWLVHDCLPNDRIENDVRPCIERLTEYGNVLE